ncbi:MAG: hypothetical protein JW969_13980 [Spirochaetales bacterium]|nr:hypothetical protein [Spirochaetales bacterium]
MLEKLLRLFTFFILTIFINVPVISEQKINTSPPLNIWPIGDSLTYGWPGTDGYRLYLWQLLGQVGIRINYMGSNKTGSDGLPDKNHEGHGGYTTYDVLEELPKWIGDTEPDIVLLLIGTNDVLKKIPAEITKENIRRIVEKIRAHYPRAKIFLSSIPPINIWGNIMDRVIHLNVEIKTLATSDPDFEKTIFFTDVYSSIMFGDLYHDGLHIEPSGQGYRKIAENYFNGIISLFYNGETSRDEP